MQGPSQNDEEMITGINVTPLVDITLVLLIIFMVTATYIMARSIPVDLPEAATGEDVVTTFAITVTGDGATYLDGRKVDEGTLQGSIRSAKAKNKDVRVVIAADADVRHGRVVRVIDLIRKEGVAKFAINIDDEKEK
ncbi:MAG: biopolymer transporter ExbD [Deltaproteobacteria bacterium]|nr:biopolymer transporter ExbD [Deltaproteobacteria bacterium]